MERWIVFFIIATSGSVFTSVSIDWLDVQKEGFKSFSREAIHALKKCPKEHASIRDISMRARTVVVPFFGWRLLATRGEILLTVTLIFSSLFYYFNLRK